MGCRNKWKYFDFEKTEVPKGIFENNNDPHFEVIEWGGVEGPLKQLMHASLYAYLIKVCDKRQWARGAVGGKERVREKERRRILTDH